MSAKLPVVLLLKPPGAYQKFRDLAAVQGWILAETERQGPGRIHAYKETYTNADYSLGLRYIEDDFSGLHYFDVSGDAVDDAVKVLRDNLAIYSADELLGSFDQAKTADEVAKAKAADQVAKAADKVAEAIVRLGVAAPVMPNDAFKKRYLEALKHDDPAVREAALVAMSYRSWNDMKPILQDVLDHDPAEGPRGRARVFIDNWDRVPHS